eukprot:Rhum_TRINITY_DN13981_c2_g1::Rhum_TRINITY_DN13981_c2_g1_i1::g.66493::m.66493
MKTGRTIQCELNTRKAIQGGRDFLYPLCAGRPTACLAFLSGSRTRFFTDAMLENPGNIGVFRFSCIGTGECTFDEVASGRFAGSFFSTIRCAAIEAAARDPMSTIFGDPCGSEP